MINWACFRSVLSLSWFRDTNKIWVSNYIYYCGIWYNQFLVVNIKGALDLILNLISDKILIIVIAVSSISYVASYGQNTTDEERKFKDVRDPRCKIFA